MMIVTEFSIERLNAMYNSISFNVVVETSWMLLIRSLASLMVFASCRSRCWYNWSSEVTIVLFIFVCGGIFKDFW